MSRFYGFPCFDNRSDAFRRYWLDKGTHLIRIRERLEKGVDDDDEMYRLMKEYAGEEAASEALYLRLKSRRDARLKREQTT